MLEALQLLVAGLGAYIYLILFPLVILEGPIVMVICGFLLHLGYLSFWPVYLILVLGDLTADLGWYWVGFYGAEPMIRKYGRWFNISLAMVERIEKVFERHHDKIILISKVTMGFGFALATLVAAGLAKVPLARYLTLNLIGELIWTGFLLAVGFFFGGLYQLIDRGFRLAFLGFGLVVVIAALYGVSQYMRKRFNGTI